jgi:hypothetical protein
MRTCTAALFAALLLLVGCPADDDDDTGGQPDDDDTGGQPDDDSADDDTGDDDTGDDDTEPTHVTVDLMDTVWRAGEAEEDRAGLAVAAASDVDGDGLDDILVGAHGSDRSNPDAGTTYLCHGPLMDTGSLADADAMLLGEVTGDQSGTAIDGGGDADGDGTPDLLIGANKEDTGGTMAGAVYLYPGPLSGARPLAQATSKYWGEVPLDYLGIAVAFAGDVDGDGDDDLLMGATGESTAGANAGAAFLVLDPLPGAHPASDADVVLTGEDASDIAGCAVAGAGDTDGDGLDDILVGAWGADAGADDLTGAAYLLLGPVQGIASLSDADARLVGEQAGDYAGSSVASAGDVDGDGLDDILVGAWGESTAGHEAGAVYVVLGPVEGDVALADARARILGEAAGDKAGWDVAGVGDVDGDGLDDVLVGAPQDDGALPGAAYLVTDATGISSLAHAHTRFVGEWEDEAAGTAVSGAGDVDGDGIPDLLIGAWRNAAVAPDAGRVYLVAGGDLP